ncbi:hypothetical protein [Pseudotabrizicola sp. 4114]|uniref:hypothetical protein n=1 Tax=Pseudotabrizicola sp. 4114 TaxID=2817731 RepID=UPI00285C6F70|nr:hypothetical protein [Pseudorhodobacter sp. 4114]
MTRQSQSPCLAPLQVVVESLYHHLPPQMPPMMEVCLCNICMLPAQLAQMIATPVRDMPAALVREYIDSAHGVPANPDDLRAILPRILDLMARGDDISTLGTHTELRRFGDARAVHPDLFDPHTLALLDDFARLMLLHTGWAEATGEPARDTPLTLTETLLVGGWPPATVTGSLDALFATAQGSGALTRLLTALGTSLQSEGHFDLWALATYRAEAIPALADWLNRLLLSPAVQTLLLPMDAEDAPWAGALWAIAGDIAPAHFTAAAAGNR